MNVVVHYPKGEENINELKSRVAKVHAEAVSTYIKKLTCPKNQKLELLNDVQKDLRNS